MKYSQTSLKEKKRSIVKLFILFIIMATVLFVGMTLTVLVPKIDKTFDTMRGEANKTAVKMYAGQLQQYIHDRELALGDVATNTLMTNTSMLADGSNPAFRDFIRHTTLLGEDPVLTVIDAVGNILYSEANTHDANNNSYRWALPLLSQNTPIPILELDNTRVPLFKIAVPILYGKRAEGILIGRVTADPYIVFKEGGKLDNNSAIAYQKNDQKIASDASAIQIAHHESINLPNYDITFTYTSSYLPILEQKKAISQNFIFATLFGAFIIATVLFIFGRRFIVKPFQALATSQKAIASAVEGISTINAKGLYTTLNDSYANIAGYLPKELEGQLWSKNIYHEDISMLKYTYEEMLKNGKASVEVRNIKKNGTLIYTRVTMISQHAENGRFIGYYCFIKDISLQKIANEKIRKQRQDLQLIFDNVPVRIWYKDNKNCILRLNKKAAEYMGGSVDDFEGKNIYDLFPNIAKKSHDDDLAVIESNIPQLNIIEKDTYNSNTNNWLSIDKIPYSDPISKKAFIFVCAQDITKLKNAESAKNQLIDQLSYTNKELAQFAYIASHDLKAPLRGIEQLAGWIRQDCESLLPEESINHLNLMSNRVNRMGRLLDDLLAYSHVSRIDLSQESIDLKAVLNNLLDLHVEPFGFQHTLCVPDGNVLIARKPFEIIIRNLLDNAVKHHHQDKGNITIHYENINNAHIIRVSDDGPGIAPELHKKAFEMFRTLQPRDKVEGSGMGLAIIKKILARYKGSIEIQSNGDNGTTFKIIWPNNYTNLES